MANNHSKDRWFGKDKADHLCASAFLYGFGYYVAMKELDAHQLNAKKGAAAFSLSLGLVKELYDWKSQKGMFSVKDMIADVIGIGIGMVIISIGE